MDRHPKLKTRILLDYPRGTRDYSIRQSSLHTLQPLLLNPTKPVEISLFHSPVLSGAWKRILPARWNEILSVQHMKLYIFDDAVLISGANLSGLYYENRQDRYFVIRCGKENGNSVCEYFDELVRVVQDLSFSVDLARLSAQSAGTPVSSLPEISNARSFDTDSSVWLKPPALLEHPFRSPRKFSQQAQVKLQNFMHRWHDAFHPYRESGLIDVVDRFLIHSKGDQNEKGDTLIYPLLQMVPLGIREEEHQLTELLEALSSSSAGTTRSSTRDATSSVSITSGYFNFTPHYESLLTGINRSLASTPIPIRILTASARANGFFTARGIARYIPDAYTWLRHAFLRRVHQLHNFGGIGVWEYERDGWTYHAKGLWLHSNTQSPRPFLTTIGSPNFGFRSAHRDIESQLVLVTRNASLQRRLMDEHGRLFDKNAMRVEFGRDLGHVIGPTGSADRLRSTKPAGWVRWITRFIRTML